MSTKSILKNQGLENRIQQYKKPALFFILSTLIPWAFWFAAGQISWITPYQDKYLQIASILACIGLFAPLGVVYWMTNKDKALRRDISKRFFNFKDIKPIYAYLTALIMPVSIMLSMAESSQVTNPKWKKCLWVLGRLKGVLFFYCTPLLFFFFYPFINQEIK